MKANSPTTVIPADHLPVCKLGQGAECCRYVTMGALGLECEKHTDIGRVIDARVAAGTFTSVGDNCEGIMPGFQQ